MDVGIACSQRWVSLERCETRRARVCALAHAAAVLTVRVVQIDSSRLCGRGERDSAGVKGRGVDAHLLAYSGRHARTHTHTRTRTHARYMYPCTGGGRTVHYRSRPMWLTSAVQPSTAASCKYAHAQCVAPKDVGPAPAPGHDTWPTNLLHPRCSRRPAAAARYLLFQAREASSCGWNWKDSKAAVLAQDTGSRTMTVRVPDSEVALNHQQLPCLYHLFHRISPLRIVIHNRVVSVPIRNAESQMSTTFLTIAHVTASADGAEAQSRATDHRLTNLNQRHRKDRQTSGLSLSSLARISDIACARVTHEIHESARGIGITCDVAMCVRNNAILAYGITAVCRLCVRCLLSFLAGHIPCSLVSPSHTVAQFHVDAEHSSKLLCSMGYPSPSSQLAS